jgi:hypothetical protein
VKEFLDIEVNDYLLADMAAGIRYERLPSSKTGGTRMDFQPSKEAAENSPLDFLEFVRRCSDSTDAARPLRNIELSIAGPNAFQILY